MFQYAVCIYYRDTVYKICSYIEIWKTIEHLQNKTVREKFDKAYLESQHNEVYEDLFEKLLCFIEDLNNL